MTREEMIHQARRARTHALWGWLSGGNGARWVGDDGRALELSEFQFWPASAQTAEQAEFARLDTAYEAVKAQINSGEFDGKSVSNAVHAELNR